MSLEEVRKLAESSGRAAGEILELIGAMQSETAPAVAVFEDGAKRTQDVATVVEQTGEAFLSIGEAVEDVNTRIEQITAAAQQITASASSMQHDVGDVVAVAEQSSPSSGLRISAYAAQQRVAGIQIDLPSPISHPHKRGGVPNVFTRPPRRQSGCLHHRDVGSNWRRRR